VRVIPLSVRFKTFIPNGPWCTHRGGRRQEAGVGAADVRCEPRPDRFQSRTSGLDDRLRARTGRHEHQLRLAVRVGGDVVADSGYRAAEAANGDEWWRLRCPDLSQDLKDLGHRFLVDKCAADCELEAWRRGRAIPRACPHRVAARYRRRSPCRAGGSGRWPGPRVPGRRRQRQRRSRPPRLRCEKPSPAGSGHRSDRAERVRARADRHFGARGAYWKIPPGMSTFG
jgi:hypothetical protein